MTALNNLIWLIPVLPLVGFLINGFAGKKLTPAISGWIASLAVFAGFLISVGLFMQLAADPRLVLHVTCFEWIHAGPLSIEFGFLIDRLTAVMLLVVTGVGFLIHVYSIGYMSHDEGYPRFFAYLNLFVFFMLLLVMGSGFLVMFAGWEGVGLCSYLLIGFWFKNHDYNEAAKKAFVMNRIGDLGFLLGMFLIVKTFGSLDYGVVFHAVGTMPYDQPVLTAIALLLFVGAVGKSAQIPLYTWLPDAMAGPTPVSALIHAATMVTAGIYMVVRSNIIYMMAPFASEIVAVTGVLTALVAALIGLKQTDIKKVLAYSTVSQLGFMVAALGAGAYATALFHVVTHAFFKALLFLGAGSVIHAMGNEQDIRRMGGLARKLPVTHITFLIGTLAIAGAPPFAGFFSKDEILAKTYSHAPWMFAILLITSILTAIYMFRLYFLTFRGKFRGTHHQQEHLHESPASMTVPLVVLAVLSTVGGFIGMPELFHVPHWFGTFLEPVTSMAEAYSSGSVSHAFEIGMMVFLLISLAVVIWYCYKRYVKQEHVPEAPEHLAGVQRVLSEKFFVDEAYQAIIVRPLQAISEFAYTWIEKGFIGRIVNGFGEATRGASGVLKYLQTGYLGFYMFVMVISIVLTLLFTVMI